MNSKKLKPGFYAAEAPATDSSDRDPIYVVFQWTKADQATVDRCRRHIMPLQQASRWCTLKTGPGPQAQHLKSLPRWVDEIKGLREALDTGLPVQISQRDGERLLAVEDDLVTRVDCTHLTVTDTSLYVGAYGKHSGTHWETEDLTQEDR